MSAARRATCPQCRRSVLVRTADERLYSHHDRGLMCAGSGTPPVPGGGDETWVLADGSVGIQEALFGIDEVLTGGGGSGTT